MTAESTFVHEVRPRYAEVDMQGVVFNAHYLTYFDDAMTRFLEHAVGDPKVLFTEGGFDCMLVKATIEWRGGAGFDDPVAIAVDPVRLGRSSFDMRFCASVGERPVCEAVITYVSTTPGAPESQPIPPDVRTRLEARLAG